MRSTLVFLILIAITNIGFSNALSFPQNELEENTPMEIGVSWIAPSSRGRVGQFEKLELSVGLPTRVEQKMDNFLEEKEGWAQVNPFNPEQLDVKAEFWVLQGKEWYGPEVRYGFYFEDFERDTTHNNVEEWGWNKKESEDRIRIRFAPQYKGVWRCRVSVLVDGKDYIQAEEFTFECIDSENEGFLSVASNNRYFELNGKTFLPRGVNLPHPKWLEDPVSLRQGTAEYWYELRKKPAMPIAYLSYLKTISKLAETGGNYFRMMMFPYVNDIEFEKLND
ncbi:MAG: hypothetical protein JKY09_02705, partial [Crocinitomicaceae bacterium]|nr:hypothetical protein [Crocinitomicaceae bacterium]